MTAFHIYNFKQIYHVLEGNICENTRQWTVKFTDSLDKRKAFAYTFP